MWTLHLLHIYIVLHTPVLPEQPTRMYASIQELHNAQEVHSTILFSENYRNCPVNGWHQPTPEWFTRPPLSGVRTLGSSVCSGVCQEPMKHYNGIKIIHLPRRFRSAKSWKTTEVTGQSLSQCLIRINLYWHQEMKNPINYSNSCMPRNRDRLSKQWGNQKEYTGAITISVLLIIAENVSPYCQCTVETLFQVYHLRWPWKHTFNPVHLVLAV